MRYDTGRGTVHAAFWCIFLAGAVAHADEPPRGAAGKQTSSLSWVRLRGAEGCIATQALAQAVESRLGRRVFVSAAEADLSVEGRIERTKTPSGWLAVFDVRDREGKLVGTRELRGAGPECSSMEGSLAFVLSVLIEPNATSPAPPSEPAVPKEPETRIERVEVPVPVRIEVPSEPAVRLSAHVGFGGELGLLPRPGVGVAFGLILMPRSFWGVYVGGSYFFERELRRVNNGSQQGIATGSAVLGTVGLCPLVSRFGARDLWVAALCGAGSLGAVRLRGAGFTVSSGDEVLVASMNAVGHLSLRLAGPLALTGEVSFGAYLRQAVVSTRDNDVVTASTPSPVVANGILGVGVRFW